VEKKLDCLDAIEKHNQRWEDHMKKLEEEEEDKNPIRHPSPKTDIDNMLSDLSTFLNTTQREIHTPKVSRKNCASRVKDNSEGVEVLKNGQHGSKPHFGSHSMEAKKELGKMKDNKKWSCAKCTLINSGKWFAKLRMS